MQKINRYNNHDHSCNRNQDRYRTSYTSVANGNGGVRRKHERDQRTHTDWSAKRERLDTAVIRENLEKGWRQAVRELFPDFHTKLYCVPPVYFNRVRLEAITINGEKVNMQVPLKQLSDVRENEAQSRLHHTLQLVLQGREGGIIIVWNLDFDTYLNNLTATDKAKPSYSDNANGNIATNGNTSRHTSGQASGYSSENACQSNGHRQGAGKPVHTKGSSRFGFLRPRDLSPKRQRGTFDMLMISKQHGIIIGEIKSTGDAFQLSEGGMDKTEQHNIITSKLEKAVDQLIKAKSVLEYIVSDLKEKVPVRTSLMLPNLKKETVEEVLAKKSSLKMDFCRSLCKEGDLAGALRCCVFQEQLAPLGKAWEIQDADVTRLYNDWWCPLVESNGRQKLSDDLYEHLVARFCGPSTPLHVNTARNPRAEVSTLSDAVLETARCLKDWTLTQQQVEVLKMPADRVYITGPPGTGKTVTLMMTALKWARRGHTVVIASLWHGSHAVSASIQKKIQERLVPGAEQKRVRLVLCSKSKIEEIILQLKNAISGVEFHSSEVLSQAINPKRYTDTLMTDENTTRIRGEERLRDDHCSERTPMDTSVPNDRPDDGCLLSMNNGQMVRRTGLSDHSPGDSPGSTNSLDNSSSFTDGSSSETTEGFAAPSILRKDVYLIIDEAPWFFDRIILHLDQLKNEIGVVHCWATSSFFGSRPASFKEVKLIRSLRCPPVVIRELQKGAAYSTRAVYPYAAGDSGFLSSQPPLTDGPPVKRISHRGHGANDVWECEDCGRAVGRFLKDELKIAETAHLSAEKDALRLGEVLISGYVRLSGASYQPPPSRGMKAGETTVQDQGFLKGLTDLGIPYDTFVYKEDYIHKIIWPEQLNTTADPNKVQVADPRCIVGLKRAVVVAIGTNDVGATFPQYIDPWCDVIARCNSQLVVVGDMTSRLEDMFKTINISD